MKIRISLFILFTCILYGCSTNRSEQIIEDVSSEPVKSTLSESNSGNISSVCGVIFQISDYDAWLAEYKKRAQGTIIVLRNVNDPSLLVAFEGGNSLEMVQSRAAELTDEEFLETASVMGEPVVSYYDVQYMSPSEKDYKYYVAMIFEMEDINQFLESLKEDIDLYTDYGLTPTGIGTNPFNPEGVFMLLSLDDFVSFRKLTNSPKKFNRFIESLNLPKETNIVNFSKTSLE